MNDFTYHNIFETKGIEYLVIIAFLILIVPFWMIINRRFNIKHQLSRLEVLTADVLRIPQGFYFSKNHSWAYLEKSGLAKIGVDDFLLKVVGSAYFKPSVDKGSYVKKGQVIAEIVQDDKNMQIKSPVTGVIENINTRMVEDPALLNSDPYSKGWMYMIKPENWKTETVGCYLADEAYEWIKAELARLKDFLAVGIQKTASVPVGVAYQEGGEIRQNVLSDMDTGIWSEFQQEFLA